MPPISAISRVERSISFLLVVSTQLIQLPVIRPRTAMVPVETVFSASLITMCFINCSGVSAR